MKGVWQLPFSALKASLPVLGNPFNVKKANSLTYEQFRYGFANAVSEKEAKELYDRWTIPAPCRPLFQAATASFAATATETPDPGSAASAAGSAATAGFAAATTASSDPG